jgi:hypothetical protein
MTIETLMLVYPDGDTQETDIPLKIDQLVDLNGRPLRLPVPSHRIIAYRVHKIRQTATRGEEVTRYYLELVTAAELIGLASRSPWERSGSAKRR